MDIEDKYFKQSTILYCVLGWLDARSKSKNKEEQKYSKELLKYIHDKCIENGIEDITSDKP